MIANFIDNVKSNIRTKRGFAVSLLLVALLILPITVLFIREQQNLEGRAAEAAIATIEPENGTLSGNATIINDPTASGGQYITFGGTNNTGTMNIYFGSTHNHTGCCNDHGQDTSTTQQVLDAARNNNVIKFDWLMVTEHSGKSGPSSKGMDGQAFYDTLKSQIAVTGGSTFVGLAGYEYSDNDGGGGLGNGHMTGVNTDAFMSADGTNNSATLMDYLVAQRNAGRPAYGGFNHPDVSGHPGSVASVLNDARRHVIVMSEVHNGYNDGGDAGKLTALIVMLDRGWRIGPVCGLDGHGIWNFNNSREPGPCRTGVLAPSLTKGNIDDAFIQRRFYTSRDTNMRVQYKANGQWMGSTIGTPATVNFDIQISDPDTSNTADRISKVEILSTGGTVVASQTFSSHTVLWQPTVQANGSKWFMVRVFNGERTNFTAVTAPVWLEGTTPTIAPTSAPTATPQPTSTTGTAGIKVSGNKFLKDGVPFYPKGFNMIGLLQPDICPNKSGPPTTAAANFNQTEMNALKNTWTANTLRLQISQKGMDPQDPEFKSGHAAYLTKVKNGVALARSNGFVVILSMQDQRYGCGYAHPLPSPETVRAWQELAPQFMNDPYIMFELFNESDSDETSAGWNQWRNGGSTPVANTGTDGSTFTTVGHQQLVNTIRSLGATNVILADGANKGGKLQGLWTSATNNYMLVDTLATPQIGLSIHPYYFHIADNSSLATDQNNWEQRFGYMRNTNVIPLNRQVPISVTEWNASAICHVGQAARTPEFLQWLKSKDFGAIMHAGDIAGGLLMLNVPGWQPSTFTSGGSECTGTSDAGEVLQDFFSVN